MNIYEYRFENDSLTAEEMDPVERESFSDPPSTRHASSALDETRSQSEMRKCQNVAYRGFARPDENNVSVVLDLASMRKDAGKATISLFLIPWVDGTIIWNKSCKGVNPTEQARRSAGQRGNWYKKVAERVKVRWEARAVSHWCGLCGKPDAWKRCERCGTEYYCSEAHSRTAWKH
ncbi:hypothetical protein PILCRDRAFT_87463 [Piloderma croceum F 1598]|uniref:MYND-type domain-containing protein n=1 Tax=Piloderma croceum (strain F 1598) TaxID=765440 RepID=A0A0C3FY65_PILCF|nr:hypothetical protein PILCRDRAFT_87463 [Piloderma croceum F 1598]